MNLSEILSSEFIRVHLGNAKNKDEVLAEIASLAKESNLLQHYNRKQIAHALSEREKSGSTGFGKGIAIPHCRLEKMEGFLVGALVFPEGVDFDAMDGEKVYIVFFIIGSSEERNRHIRTLYQISKVLQNKEAYRSLLNAKSPEEFKQIFDRFSENRSGSEPSEIKEVGEKCMMTVIVQREELFSDILQEISTATKDGLTVLETQSASHYFYRMPLFSAYWTEQKQSFNRVILAVTDKKLANEITRRICLITGDIDEKPGVMIYTQPILTSIGSLEI